MANPKNTKTLEAEGWVKKFTIEEARVQEYVELYENIGLEVRVEPVVPEEVEGCNTCFAAECTRFKAIFTRTTHKET